MKRRIENRVKGFRTSDGAGVSLVRVLGHGTVDEYDPILMLDSFDSEDPEDYIKGFPMHPHRGIETISLIVKGNMVHRDSLGNEDGISDGQVQWMTAGSGIMHEEMLPASERMLGVQLWLNMPRDFKMAKPEYHSLKEIEKVDLDGASLRVVSVSYAGVKGFQPKYSPLEFYHISIEAGKKLDLEMEEDKLVMVFTLLGSALVAGEEVEEKTALKLSEGTSLELAALDEDCQILYLESRRLDEPVAWGGPIVMNSQEELRNAYKDLREGSFLRENLDY